MGWIFDCKAEAACVYAECVSNVVAPLSEFLIDMRNEQPVDSVGPAGAEMHDEQPVSCTQLAGTSTLCIFLILTICLSVF